MELTAKMTKYDYDEETREITKRSQGEFVEINSIRQIRTGLRRFRDFDELGCYMLGVGKVLR